MQASDALPDPQAPAPELAPELGFTAQDLIDQQEQLETQASEALPFRIDKCTHSLGALRQPVYACRTCGGGGVCAACSVVCHGEHELVELFHKRNFRCDCGTPSLYRERVAKGDVTDTGYPPDAVPCTLRKGEKNKGWDVPNDNAYSHNFQGHFCVCERGKTYDPETEEEEWLHESCTSFDASVLRACDFDGMICHACLQAPDAGVLRTYAGTAGWMLPTASGPEVWDGVSVQKKGNICLYGAADAAADAAASASPPHSPPAKKSRKDACRAPASPHPAIVSPLKRHDVFLAPSFRARLCRCSDCAPAWAAYPYVYDEEETYDPPADADDAASATSGSSTYDRAVAALGHLPRPQMLESLRAYQGLRDALYEHLRPFAERHELVSEEAVRAFFREQEAQRQSPTKASR